MFSNPKLASYLDMVTALYIAGVFPTIERPLANLNTLIFTSNCSPYITEHDSKLNFKWVNLDKIEITADWERDLGETYGRYIDECPNCKELTCVVEHHFAGDHKSNFKPC